MIQRTLLAARMCSFSAGIAAILAFSACSSNEDETGVCIADTGSLLMNFTSNYETGELRWMNTDSESLKDEALLFDQDSKVTAHNGKVFVLEKTLNNLNCFSPCITQVSLEQNANPHDVAVIGNEGFIALWGLDYLQSFDTGACRLGTKINLPISGANATSIHASGDTLLVVSQRLEFFAATKPGLLIRMRASTGALIDTIPLNLYNPSSSVLSNGKLYVSSQGAYDEDYNSVLEIDGVPIAGVEVVDLTTKVSEVIATGTELGGATGNLALDETNKILYVGVTVYWGNAPVKPINLADKSIGEPLPNIANAGSFVFDSVAKKLFVGDASGIKIYNTATKLTTAVSQDANALPPISLDIVRW